MTKLKARAYWAALLVAACGDSSTSSRPPTPAPSPGAPPAVDAAIAGPPAGIPLDLPIYIQPTRVCKDAVSGQPAGTSEGGKVCTWQSVAGATEEGRRFRDYADCDVVRTQRPYYPMPPNDTYQPDDPRLKDPKYKTELDWVRGQIDAVGCSCCHSSNAPKGPVRWSVDMPGNWATAMKDRDVAALADWIDTRMFERFPSEENNGFKRPHGIPSTDPDRVKAFFEGEAKHRGRTQADYANAAPTGGLLLELAAYVPARCAPGEGVDQRGMISWTGGPARYIHVMAAGSANPTVPPDRDTPKGTLWRVDVPPAGQPLESRTVHYGDIPPGTSQRHPATGSPEALQRGREYYLYVSRDMFQPVTRCLFTAQ